ncbi:MAG TPA: hypothetical protein VHY08_10405, partial [Bacillota bacterium]|nr:hypothetical protein [Bacillota bacterium]
LVAPIFYENQRTRKVYLPVGAEWKNAFSGEAFGGGQSVGCDAPLDIIPLFVRDNANLPI